MGGTLLDFFSSPIGLGHATRDAAIAQRLGGNANAKTGAGAGAHIRTRFVTGGGAARILRNLGFDVRDLYCGCPSFVVRDGSLRNPGRWLWRYYRYYRGCRAVSLGVLGSDRPALVVSDEDFASLSVAQGMGIPTVLITDILQTRFTGGGVASLVEGSMNRAMLHIVQKCDCVILPEDGDDRGNIRRVGPIVRRTPLSRGDLRRRFGLDRRTVTVSVGGTAAGSFLIRRSLEAISRIDEDLDVAIVTGPAAGEAWHGGDHRDRKGHRIRNLGFIDNLHELVFASDALVSLAGRSTMDEAAAYGTPAVFIPIRGHFEQEDNAGRHGFAFGDVDRLGDLIPEMLRRQRRPPAPADGADRASEIIRGIAAAGTGPRLPPR